MDRRQLIVGGASTYLLTRAAGSALAQRTSSGSATLSLNPTAPRIPIPPKYTGLSYESAQLANPGYFSRDNRSLLTLVRQLGSSGVLRLGGSTSDYDRWKPVQQAHSLRWSDPVNPDDGKGATLRATVTETAIDELRGFLDATGWRTIYGLDLGHGSPQAAAQEAAFVVRKLGSKLLALQIGNEPDLFSRDIRPSSYGYSDYFREWKTFADAIRRRTPGAPLAGPDTTDDLWIDRFAAQARGICMLTSHYYAEGPPESPDSDIPHLLQSQPDLRKQMQHLVDVGQSVHLPYRMSEGNSCYNGGKTGVSDSFASALWGADFMLLLAQLGVSGINFHGGGHGFYAPIAGGGSAPFEVRPLYYAMLFWRAFASGSLLPCTFSPGGVNATAYACINSGRRLALAVINKDLHQDLHLRLQGDVFRNPAQEMALAAPQPNSTSGVTLSGQSVVDGVWHPVWSPRARDTEISVPRASALLLQWEGVSL
jgi:hypothetical protein